MDGDGVGDAVGVGEDVGRATWATGRADPGPSVAGSAATTSSRITAVRTSPRTRVTGAGR